jgi:hypothetical protein
MYIAVSPIGVSVRAPSRHGTLDGFPSRYKEDPCGAGKVVIGMVIVRNGME